MIYICQAYLQNSLDSATTNIIVTTLTPNLGSNNLHLMTHNLLQKQTVQLQLLLCIVPSYNTFLFSGLNIILDQMFYLLHLQSLFLKVSLPSSYQLGSPSTNKSADKYEEYLIFFSLYSSLVL